MIMSQPFYHLRPNKYVDRCLFLNVLERLGPFLSIMDYRYIGFGSYLFDDFKLVHERLHISSMISLENDASVFKRAKYNAPYNCIEIVNQTSTDYISNGDWDDKKSVIWLDYTSPKQLPKQFSDIASLLNKTIAHDIVRVTFNANADTLGKLTKEYGLENRMEKFKSRMSDYLPADYYPADFNKENYPLFILKCLRLLISDAFIENEYDRKFLLPVFSTVYQDGEHRMLTFTGIVLDDYDEVNKIKGFFSDIPYVDFEWDNPSKINIPGLTVKEMLEINKMLPSNDAEKQIEESFDFVFEGKEEEICSYTSFYKYYPSFLSVNF